MYSNILVPIDLDHAEEAAKALATARGFVRAKGATLSVISIRPGIIEDDGKAPPADRRRLAAFLAAHGGAGGIREIREASGPAATSIRAAAREIGADLIVMGARDPGFADSVVGPDAAHVTIFTPCSVLLVR